MAAAKEKKQERLIEFYDSFPDLFQFFCNNTTIHGSIRLACSSKNKMKTTFWVVLFITSLCMLYWQLGLLTGKYWSYFTKTNIHMSTNSKVEIFPAITICTQNPYRFDAVNEQLIHLDQWANKTISTLYKYNIMDGINGDPEVMALDKFSKNGHLVVNTSFSLDPSIQLERLTDDGSRPAPPGKHSGRVGFRLCNASGGDCYYKSYWSVIDALQEWYFFHYMNIMSRVPVMMGIPEDEQEDCFVLGCQFSGRSCSKSEYVKFHHAVHGSCYNFNHNGSESTWNTSKPGIPYGLSLIVELEQKEHLPLLSVGTGARVLVYKQKQPLDIDQGGYDVKLGTETSISIQKDEMTWLGGSYSQCTEDGSDVDVKLLYSEAYSLQACVHSCFQYKMVQQCRCGYYLYPLPPGAEYCNYNTHPGWGHCFYRLHEQLKEHTLGCFAKCPKSCRETLFKMTAGTARWPHSFTDERIFEFLLQKDQPGAHSRKNLAKINIFFQGISVQQIDETAAMTIIPLLSEMGAIWALWFGSSVLSVAELVELIFDAAAMSLILVYSRWGGTKPSPTESTREGWSWNTRKDGENSSSEDAERNYIQDEDKCTHPRFRAADDSNDPPSYLSTIAVVHALPDIIPDGPELWRTHFTESDTESCFDECI